MSTLAAALLDELDDASARALADRLAPHIAAPSPWLSAAEAAEYLRCPLSRVRKATMTRDIHHRLTRSL